ncbi:MAG: tRNA (adenosine(37)-N6)-threonylcarbamoyltransferase complex ATPase subunit type 1 TsaE [Robiginitomaculum sp.]
MTTDPLTFDLKDEAATRALGARLGARLKAGDIICLSGELGAGKTSLSRGLIMALTGAIEVPSPTYTLVQTYNAPQFEIWHFDLYRLKSPEEIWQLGVEDAFYDGACLIEWPSRLGDLRPEGTLDIEIIFNGDGRKAIFTPPPHWEARLHDL